METKQYFQSPLRYVVPLVFATFMLGVIGIAGIAAAKPQAVTLGVITLLMLGACYSFIYILTKRPSLRIENNHIAVRGAMGRLYRIDDVREYSLVLASDWVGFRKKGQNDIILEQGRFPKKVWPEMLNELQKLPFANVA